MPLHGFTSELQRAYETALFEQAGEGTGYRKSFEPLDPKPYACLKTFFVPSPFIYIFMLKPIGHILLTLLSIAYPLLWYYGREHGAFFWLAAAMCGLWLIRAALQKTRAQQAVSLLLAAFFAAVLLFRRPDSMYWYPVAVSLLMLAVFGASLFAKQTLIERLARLQHPDLPPAGVRHTRRVTQIWCGFFVFNAATAALLAWSGKHDWWALYTGIISYGLMGVLFAGEWVYRKVVLKV